MLDKDQLPTVESPEHQNEAMREYYVDEIDEPVQLPQEIELSKSIDMSKRRLKNKKKYVEILNLHTE